MKDTKACRGCRDDFYNGHNELGVKRCWSADTAKMEKRMLIPVDLAPPYKHIKPRLVPSCYSPPRTVNVKLDRIGADGFWRR